MALPRQEGNAADAKEELWLYMYIKKIATSYFDRAGQIKTVLKIQWEVSIEIGSITLFTLKIIWDEIIFSLLVVPSTHVPCDLGRSCIRWLMARHILSFWWLACCPPLGLWIPFCWLLRYSFHLLSRRFDAYVLKVATVTWGGSRWWTFRLPPAMLVLSWKLCVWWRVSSAYERALAAEVPFN